MNWYFVLKCLISGLVVGIVSELSKRSPGFGAIVASLPLTSILAIIWLYKDTKDVEGVISLSNGIALVVLPSIVFFLILSLLLRLGWSFSYSMISSCIAMSLIYIGYVAVMNRFGIKI